ncbi:MAG: threonine--tRNA ligase [Candidatus Njordarchaeales archaeon]
MSHAQILLPNGEILEGEIGKRIVDIIPRGSGIVAKVNGKLVDLAEVIREPSKIEILGFDSPEARFVYWHSTAHILAYAVKELYPDFMLGIGHPFEQGLNKGFFYEFFTNNYSFTEEDLEKIEAKMREIIKQDIPFRREVISREEAIKIFSERGEKFKVELLNDISEDLVSVYWIRDFVDLCRGPHVPSTGVIKYFKLLNVSAAYWKGIEGNPVMQRIYGISFPEKKMLREYLNLLEEARRRDHRKLGPQLDLFDFFEEVGPGLVVWLPRGALIRRIVENYLIDIHLENGYQILYTPHIARGMLYEISGHLKYYRENMFLFNVDNELYAVKPMNCPIHILVYKRKKRSYRELPIRYFELGTVYRFERSGVLHGILRVRGFTQDDAHIFCTPEQIEDELINLLKLTRKIMMRFGITELEAELSTRDPSKPDKYMGSPAVWDIAEEALARALEKEGIDYRVMSGEAAFYGPKIDIKITDALGRKWQCTTIQLDFNLPRRFGATYVTPDNKEEYVVMIHRALLGSLERFLGILIEHYGGDFPLWIAPVQSIIIPVSDKILPYAQKICEKLRKAGIRVLLDTSHETVSKKIRNAELNKIPYIIVVGQREMSKGTINVRRRKVGILGDMTIEELLERLRKEILGENTSK